MTVRGTNAGLSFYGKITSNSDFPDCTARLDSFPPFCVGRVRWSCVWLVNHARDRSIETFTWCIVVLCSFFRWDYSMARMLAKPTAKKPMAKSKGKPSVWKFEDDVYISFDFIFIFFKNLVSWQFKGANYIVEEQKWRVRPAVKDVESTVSWEDVTSPLPLCLTFGWNRWQDHTPEFRQFDTRRETEDTLKKFLYSLLLHQKSMHPHSCFQVGAPGKAFKGSGPRWGNFTFDGWGDDLRWSQWSGSD